MWVTDRKFETLSESFATGGDGYEQWLESVAATLPGVADNPPQVSIESVDGGGDPPSQPSSLVTITMRWKAPQDAADDPPSSLTVVTRIK
jgi:hypothetical protein